MPDRASYLSKFCDPYIERTRKSKEVYARAKQRVASPPYFSFTPDTREINYPIVSARAKGGHFWDVDGNEYVDMCSSFGLNLLGHGAEFVNQALREALDRGVVLGPRAELAGEVAERLCEMTGHERCCFVNTGTEAVMIAIRLARAATMREKIVMFAGAFHGQSDGVLAQSFGDDPTGQPVLFGILPATTHATLVFEPVAASLERIEAMRSDIAAVLIEPVFSRAPEAVTPEFLQQLRALTQKIDCALVFDEIVTGFRLGQRGAAGHFGVRPDMATLGKIIGGGIPIGVVAGSSRFMNGVDAGGYNFGDDSMPFAPPTYVAGTFSKNPLAMAAANAMLVEIEKRGPSLYQQLEAHAARLHAALRDACEGLETVRAQRRGTLVALVFSSEGAEFFERGMIHLGVFIKGGHFSLSAAHSEEDIDRAAQAARTTLAELRDAGIVS